MGLLKPGINEVIATTEFNAAPMGIIFREGVARMVVFSGSHTAKNIENEVLNFFRYCNPNSVDNEAVHFVLCGVKLTEVYFIKITGEDSGVSGYENSTTI